MPMSRSSSHGRGLPCIMAALASRRLALLAILAVTACEPTPSASALTAEEHFKSQVEWLESRGGFFSPKITYRPVDPAATDPDSFRAMFVDSPVDRDEVLMVIPRSCVFTTATEHVCDTVRRLAHEYELGAKSEFYPYVHYVFDPRHDGDLPSTWTDEGKEVLRRIAGHDLFDDAEYDVAGMEYEDWCGGHHPNPTENELKAYHHVLRRSWDDVLLPVYDMVNHRNPPYTNVDSNSPHEEDKPHVYVTALRDISAGEQLYLSYNQCTDCAYDDEYAYNYVTPYLLRDYGFVEQYPQRFKLFGGELRFSLEERTPELVPGAGGGGGDVGTVSALKLTWFDGPPTPENIATTELSPYLHGHLRLLESIPVRELVRQKNLPPHEAYTSVRFHDTLMNMLRHLIWYVEDVNEDVHVGGTVTHPVSYGLGATHSPFYDLTWTYNSNDDDAEYEVKLQERTCTQAYLDTVLMVLDEDVTEEYSPRYERIGKVKSPHQMMTFWQSREGKYDEKDVMMKIERNWESCQSNRPHYHEMMVHYPASFVPEVRRVMFLGGGDNMVLHEVLKYKTLELVVGLELDKTVNQASFVYFDTQPHFDDDRVEWWFGDASQSLKLLPRDYLSSFDLIMVDMQNFIVTGLNLMEEVSRYAHPLHGILLRNEDHGWGTNEPFALHNIDFYDGDVPVFCHQLFTLGSNVVDFLTAPRTEHDVSNLYYDPKASTEDRFGGLYNYRKVDKFGVSAMDSALKRKETPSAGILMILELEQVTAENISADNISKALTNAGISVSETKMVHDTMVFLAQDGYVMARPFPQERYCAFDVRLWSNYEKISSVKQSLVLALGSKITSSYRIVAGGMFGASQDGEENIAVEEKEKDEISPSCNEDDAVSVTINQSHANAAMKNILSSISHDVSSSPPEILVLCGEGSQPCQAWENAVNFSQTSTLERINACPASESYFACESNFRSAIRNIMKRGNKINAVLIDASVPQRSGQILHRIFAWSEYRGKALSDNLAVMAVTMDQSSSSSWIRVLLDRFRTDFFPYNPSFHAEVIFNPPRRDTSKSGKSAGLGVSLYSAGNPRFYTDFVRTVREISETTGLSSDVRYVKNGMNNFVADFTPSHEFSRGSYDRSAAREQRSSHKPLGRQTIWQFEAKAPSTEYTPTSIASRLETVLLLMGIKKGAYEVHNNKIGDGCVVFALWKGGDASIIFDGRSQLELNLFTLVQDEEVHVNFERHFVQNTPSVALKLADMQPRGTGRVVVFDTGEQKQDCRGRSCGHRGGLSFWDLRDTHNKANASNDK